MCGKVFGSYSGELFNRSWRQGGASGADHRRDALARSAEELRHVWVV
jgi:hypothetical protein